MDQIRKIIHIDMDAFFASVEQRDFPELRGKPVVVGGLPGKRGVVAAASYEARRFGVFSAMPSSQARAQCPHAIFVHARFEVYRQVSSQIRSIFREYTDLVEPLSLDEAFLDVTQNRFNNPSATRMANEIRARILQETHLTASAGVGPNKFLAKMASDINKPNGIFVITPDRAQAFIDQLPIGKFHGIGKATEKKMQELKVFNGADLRQVSELDLVRHFGKTGAWYFRIARGIDLREVVPHRLRKSVGVEETFTEDLTRMEQLERSLKDLARDLSRRLQKAELAGKTITLKLRYANFETLTRGRTLDQFMNDERGLFRMAFRLLEQVPWENKRIRLLGITVSNLNNQEDPVTDRQLLLPFGDEWY